MVYDCAMKNATVGCEMTYLGVNVEQVHCYCDTDLCNNQVKIGYSLHLLTSMSLLSVALNSQF